jgi:hypothetical protein
MADNVTIPASGTGTATPEIATDDVGGVHYQRVKLDLGADGAAAPAVGTVPVSGTVTVSEPVSVDDNGGSLTVDGTVAVTHAALTELATAIDTELQVDIVGALPAGNANIGDVDVASIAAGDNNIGNVDIVTMPNVTLNEPVSIDDNVTASNVTGNVAHDAADSGNPIKIGGKAVDPYSAPANVAAGDRVDASLGLGGEHLVTLVANSTDGMFPVYVHDLGSGDGVTDALSGAGGLATHGRNYVYNGSTWDRQRGDTLGLHISRPAQAATATLSNVNDTASSTTLLAANTSRKGATIHNDSTSILYVKFGTTASATSYTVKMVADAYYEVPFGYTGRIDGIWSSDSTGAARITEMT